MSDQIKITIPALTRVEGEGALTLNVSNGIIDKLELSIYEPPRLFEQSIVGRYYFEVADMVARICGICPVAYQMSAVQALEAIYEITPTPWVDNMRRLYYCGEWIESHALHIHLLALPDFLGFNSVIEMAEDYPQQVNRGLALQHVGNELIALLGGRSVNPVGAKVGGFYAAPDKGKVAELLKKVTAQIDQAYELVSWVSELDYPKLQQDFIYASLFNGKEYPMCYGDIKISDGLVIPISEFETVFSEKQVSYSTALHCLYKDQNYLVGPLARLNNNLDLLPTEIHSLIEKINFRLPSKNVYDSIVARALEILLALLEAKEILANYQTEQPFSEAVPKAGIGFGGTEAPRGMLWHRYESDEQGTIRACTIVPPTSQNQARIEADIKYTLEQTEFKLETDQLRLMAEQVIRNYDPCISCATHFLKFRLDRQ